MECAYIQVQYCNHCQFSCDPLQVNTRMKIRFLLILTLLILSVGVSNSLEPPKFLSKLIHNLFIGFNDNDKVIWPMKSSPLPEFPKHATVFGFPIFATSDYSVRQKLFH